MEDRAAEAELSVAIRDRIDDVCDRFEAAWTAGHEPSLPAFLNLESSLADHQSALLKELLELDLHYRREQGTVLPRWRYLELLGEEHSALIAALPDPAGESTLGNHGDISLDELGDRLAFLGLVSTGEFETYRRRHRDADSTHVVEELIQHGKLTPYQLFRIEQGEADQLVLGQYVILDQLGEGGMGVVYRAFHRRMQR
ncbi:MAG: hypothetical protein KDB14_00855, partial [Planctomycetales bacterium]|nr:hypothetical protein [Planctomycetales bacterium]